METLTAEQNQPREVTEIEIEAATAAFGAAGTFASVSSALATSVVKAGVSAGASYADAAASGAGAAAPFLAAAAGTAYLGYDLVEGNGLDRTRRAVNAVTDWLQEW